MKKRTCGECVACCVYPSIETDGLRKRDLTPCPNLKNYTKEIENDSDGLPIFSSESYQLPCTKNCTIHETKPECCKGYECAWLQGYGHEKDRPDKSGVMVDLNVATGHIKNAFVAKQLWKHSAYEEKGRKALTNISKSSKKPILLLEYPGNKLIEVIGKGL